MNVIVIPQTLFAGAVTPLKEWFVEWVSALLVICYWAYGSLVHTIDATAFEYIDPRRTQWDVTVAGELDRAGVDAVDSWVAGLAPILAHCAVYGVAALLFLAAKDGKGGVRRFVGAAYAAMRARYGAIRRRIPFEIPDIRKLGSAREG